ncbi:MAG: FixH family protein [Chloroflexi bacterium]|nr:FixH family protein [Chloroflexota bacterium]
MKRWFLFLIIAVLLSAACTRASRELETAADVEVQLMVEPAPPVVGEAVLVITITDETGAPLEDAKLDIKGDMAHAGMKPVLATAERGEGGVYRVPFEWTMAGDWFVTIRGALPDGRTFSRRFDVSVGGEMDMNMDGS